MSENVNSTNDDAVSLFLEAAYPDAIPYTRTVHRQIYLPKGEPIGKGNLCYLYSHNVKESLEMMTNRVNFIGKGFYNRYYYPITYKGTLHSKVFNIRKLDERKLVYTEVENSSTIQGYPKAILSPTDNWNMYYELFEYLNIFDKYCSKLSTKMKVETYWKYIKSIFTVPSTAHYSHKFVLVNLNNFQIKEKIADNLSNPLYMIYYTLYKYPDLLKGMNVDWYFYTDKRCLKINPSDICDTKQSYRFVLVEMKKIYNYVSPAVISQVTDEKNLDNDAILQTVASQVQNIVKTTEYHFTGEENDKAKELMDNAVADAVNKVKKDIEEHPLTGNQDEIEDKVNDKISEELNKNKDLLEMMYKQTVKAKTPSSSKSSARDQMLKDAQQDLKIGSMTIKEIEKINANSVALPTKEISAPLNTINDNIKKVRFQNFEKTYNEKVMKKDIANAFLSLNDKSIPMYIRNIEVKETSDELNYKDTYTVYLEDANRQRHTIKVDIPKFLDDRYIFIGGNEKQIKHQEFLYPVVKTGEDTVQIVSNYNKMFIRRADNKSLSSIERFRKVFNAHQAELKKYLKIGNAYTANKSYITTIEYDEFSKIFNQFKNGLSTIFFNQQDAVAYAEEHNIKVPANNMFIGTDKAGKNIFIDINTQISREGKYIVDYILDCLDDTYIEEYKSIKAPKRLMYTKVVVMEKEISVALLLCFWEGLTEVLKKANVEYRIENQIPRELQPNESFIRFSNCVLVYKETVPIALLLNGIRVIDTSQYDISDMDTDLPYMNYFLGVYGQSNIGNALLNFYEFFIDPITKEVCQDLHLPTEIVPLVIYAVALLADSQHINESDQHVSRIRSNEIIAGILYEALAKAYVQYRNSNGKKKYSVKQDIVIKNLIGLKTVEDLSVLNPSLEMEMNHSISAKGFRGANVDRAYTMDKRAYHKSMIGVIAPSSSPDGSVGVARTLTLEPTVTGVRGYVDIYSDGKTDKLKDVNLFSPGELSIPLGATRDDPTRLGHAIKQSKHVIPVKNSSPVLMSNGMEEVARFHLSSNFVINADEDGSVVEYDDETKIMIVQYKSGKCRAINLGGTIVKNGGGGFFLNNILVTDLKVGDKFKKDAVLAYHKDFFTNSKFNNCRMNMGTLTKIAIMSTYNTYEDATMITHKLSEDASTEMCFRRPVIIGKNSNVEYMVKVGDNITVGDSLIRFDTSYEDNELNELLARIANEDDRKELLSESKNNIHSKYSGVIEDIKMYSPLPLEQLSPSLQKILGAYYKRINRKKALLEKYDPESKDSIVKCGLLCTETTKEIEPNKYGVIKGEKVSDDSILIEFYIKHSEPLEIGSKIANFTALKNTVGEIIPEGQEPWSESRPDEEVGTIIASNSILKRMTPSIVLTALGNKNIIELKRALQKIYEE